MQSTSKLLTVIRSIFPVSSRHIGASACAAAAAGETNQPSGGGRRDARKGGGGAMNVFDRHAKKLQKARAAVAEDAHLYDYLKDHVSRESGLCFSATTVGEAMRCNSSAL